MVTLVSIATGVMVMVMKGVSDVCQFHERTWIYHQIHVAGVHLEEHSFHLFGLGVLKGVNLRLLSLLFSLDDLEMMYHHSKWVLGELCFSCRLCH